MRVVWAVGSNVGWPPEVYVLFSREADAERHVGFSSYAFSVFPMPVYDRYAEIPPALRSEQGSAPGLGTLAEDEAQFARLLASGGAISEAQPSAPVHALGAWEQQGVPEVWALYTDSAEADHHAANSQYVIERRTLPVFASYAHCPRELRYLDGGQALSQLVRTRRA